MEGNERSTDVVVRVLARRQHGVVHRRQLLAEGATYRELERRLANGALIELGNGVYAVPSSPASTLRQYKAAELAVPGAVLCDLAAANLHDLGATTSAAPEIAVHPSANHRCVLARVHRRKDVEHITVRGIRVTTVPQTLVDIAGRLTISRLDEVWTSALIRRRTTLEELADRVAVTSQQRLRHRGPASAVLTSLTEGTELADSELEEVLYRLACEVVGPEEVVRQLPLPWWKEGRGRGDVGIPSHRLILEADGRSWHARLRDFDADRMRDNLAVANGYAVLRFGAVALQRSPDEVVGIIAAASRHRRSA